MKLDWEFSYCGLNCARCSLYLIPEEKKSAEQVLTWFKSQKWRPEELTVDEFMKNNGRECEKCRGPENKCWTEDCFFRSCAIEKGLDYCFQCENLPCEKLSAFANDGAPHHKQTLENLEIMKKIGLKAFIESHSKPTFCPSD